MRSDRPQEVGGWSVPHNKAGFSNGPVWELFVFVPQQKTQPDEGALLGPERVLSVLQTAGRHGGKVCMAGQAGLGSQGHQHTSIKATDGWYVGGSAARFWRDNSAIFLTKQGQQFLAKCLECLQLQCFCDIILAWIS